MVILSLSLTSPLASFAVFIYFAHRPVRNQLIPSFFFSNCVFSFFFFFLVEGRFFPVRQSLPFLSDDFTLHSPPLPAPGHLSPHFSDTFSVCFSWNPDVRQKQTLHTRLEARADQI